jgi:DNA-binding PadR family transcriptional regulator
LTPPAEPYLNAPDVEPRRRGIAEQTGGLADRELYTGLIRLHVLHHASEGPVFGLEMIEELRRHGYRLSPGTLYPLLHGLEKRGFLTATEERNGSSTRRVYRATRTGRAALKAARAKVRELFGELFETEGGMHAGNRLAGARKPPRRPGSRAGTSSSEES